MRAVYFERNGGPEVLECQDRPAPEGEVLVDVEAVGINYRDVYERQGGGYGSPPPAIIGVEGAGKIHDTGERVAWVGVPGSYAEQVAAPRDRFVPVPDGVDAEVAAAALLQGMTAHYLAADSYPACAARVRIHPCLSVPCRITPSGHRRSCPSGARQRPSLGSWRATRCARRMHRRRSSLSPFCT